MASLQPQSELQLGCARFHWYVSLVMTWCFVAEVYLQKWTWKASSKTWRKKVSFSRQSQLAVCTRMELLWVRANDFLEKFCRSQYMLQGSSPPVIRRRVLQLMSTLSRTKNVPLDWTFWLTRNGSWPQNFNRIMLQFDCLLGAVPITWTESLQLSHRALQAPQPLAKTLLRTASNTYTVTVFWMPSHLLSKYKI